MVENVFYHEDLVINIDHVNHAIHCGHVEGEAFMNLNESAEITSTDSFDQQYSSEMQIVAPKQFGDKSSDHDDTIDSLLLDPENQFDTGYFDGPFRGNVYVRWNSDYYDNMAILNNEVPTFDEYISGTNLIKMDRYHQLSDVVKHSTSSKVGIVNKIRKRAYAEIIGSNKLLADIDCSKLKNIEKFFPGTNEQLVIHNSWLGRVTSIMRDVVLKFPDGAKIRTSENAIENFEPLFKSNLPDIIFRGSALKGDARDLKNNSTKFTTETLHFNSNWFKQLHQQQIIEVIIVKVIISSAKVDWLMFKPVNGVPENGIVSPPTIIKGTNLQNLKSVNFNPYLYCYTGDIWYYQLKPGDKTYNLDEEYTVSKLLYKIYMKENINHLRYYIKANKPTKEKETKIDSAKKSSKLTNQKNVMTSNKKLDNKVKVRNQTDKKQDNQNYLTYFTDNTTKISTYSKHKIKSIYNHLQFRCNKDQLFFQSKSFTRDPNDQQRKLQKKEITMVNSLNQKNLKSIHNSNTNSGEDQKVSTTKDSKSKTNLSKLQKKINYQQLRITHEMVISYLGNLVAGTWVPIHLILIESLVDVTWQDGSVGHRIPSILFIPEEFEIDEYDFFPGDFVSLKKASNNQDANDLSLNSTFGCVIKAKNTERIAVVQWFRVLADNFCSKIGKPEQCGSYDIKHHKKHHYHIGDIVAISSSCSKTNFPAGCINSVQPSKGRLSIKWHNSKDTYLSPLELFGIVWDLVSDDFFTSSDDTFEISSVKVQNELENVKFENTLVNFDKQEITTKHLNDLIRQILKIIDDMKKRGFINDNKNEYVITNDKFNEFVNFLTKKVSELKKMSTEKSINIICDSFLSNKSDESDSEKNVKIENFENQILPSTSNAALTNTVELQTSKNSFKLKELSVNTSTNLNDETKTTKKSSKKKSATNTYKENIEDNQIDQKMLNKMFNLEKSLINWHKINSINEISIEKNHKDLYSTVTKDIILENPFNDDMASLIKIGNQNKRISQSMPFTLPEIEWIKDHLNKPVYHSLSLEDNTHEISEKNSSLENNHSSFYDPLPTDQLGFFEIVSNGVENHKYLKLFNSSGKNRSFTKAWKKDCYLLSTSLPRGIWVKNFEERVDLFSVMIEGPEGTPYQYTLFFFDIHLTSDYPNQPPLVYYISLTNDKVNPNLYPDGRVCLSLLGTWIGRGTENWDPKVSNLLQIILSIQGLILVTNPYFNEAGFEHRRGTVEGQINSKRYNESVITSIGIAMAHLIDKPLVSFKQEILNYYSENGKMYTKLLKFWTSLDDKTYNNFVQNSKLLITEIQSSSEVTKSICDINKNSLKSDANTDVLSIWSEDELPFKVDGIVTKLENCIELDTNQKKFKNHKIHLPKFLLAPVSKGFSLTLNKYITVLEKALHKSSLY